MGCGCGGLFHGRSTYKIPDDREVLQWCDDLKEKLRELEAKVRELSGTLERFQQYWRLTLDNIERAQRAAEDGFEFTTGGEDAIN